MADSKFYKVPGRNTAATESAMKKRIAEDVQKPDSTFDFVRRANAKIGDALESRPSKRTRMDELEADISARDQPYKDYASDKEAFAKALKNKEEVDPYSTKETLYKKGGAVKFRGDGLAQRGRTKGRFV